MSRDLRKATSRTKSLHEAAVKALSFHGQTPIEAAVKPASTRVYLVSSSPLKFLAERVLLQRPAPALLPGAESQPKTHRHSTGGGTPAGHSSFHHRRPRFLTDGIMCLRRVTVSNQDENAMRLPPLGAIRESFFHCVLRVPSAQPKIGAKTLDFPWRFLSGMLAKFLKCPITLTWHQRRRNFL